MSAPAATPTPAAAPAAEPVAEDPLPTDDPAPTETPTNEETPAAETTEGEEAPAAPADESDEDGEDGGEGPVTPHSGKRAHLRLADGDEVGRLAAAYKKRNRDWTLEQSLDAAKKQLGVKTPAAETTAPKPKSDMPETMEAADAVENDLLEKKSKAYTDLNFEEVAKIDAALRKLDRHRTTLEKQSEQAQNQQAASYGQAFDASHARAVDLYPFVLDAASPGGRRMKEIEETLKDTEDPLYTSPDKPLKLAQMVAAELNIAPKRKGAPAAPTVKSAAPVTPAPKKGILPGGSARTTVPVTTKPAIDTEIGSIKSVADIRKFRQRHGLPV